jgi:redox-sensitive bicupin YhaK (pirin superfamily)
MKLTKRASNERGTTQLGWLDSRHSFSFGGYQDDAHMGFRALRVINEDIVEPSRGFAQHAHRDAEILSYVLEGRLEHKDSMGNGSVIEAGNLQYMSAGNGVTHSEFNPSRAERVHFLQIWLLPDVAGGEPRYAEKALGVAAKPNALTLVFAGKPRADAIAIRSDADVFLGRLDAGERLTHRTSLSRGIWLQVVTGQLEVGGSEPLGPSDGASIERAEAIEISSPSGAEFLLFDLG